MASTRCRFRVTKVEYLYQNVAKRDAQGKPITKADGSGEYVLGNLPVVHLSPVYSTDPDHPNKAFWDATPGGHIQLNISNPAALGVFRPGVEYNIDLSPVDQAEYDAAPAIA